MRIANLYSSSFTGISDSAMRQLSSAATIRSVYPMIPFHSRYCSKHATASMCSYSWAPGLSLLNSSQSLRTLSINFEGSIMVSNLPGEDHVDPTELRRVGHQVEG